jgi:hypothetical protein
MAEETQLPNLQLTIILLLQVLQLRELVQVILVLGPSSQTVWLFLDVD